jgi:hypothetical protein
MADDSPEVVKAAYADSLRKELSQRHLCCMQLINGAESHECTEIGKEIESSMRECFLSVKARLPKVDGGKHKLFAWLCNDAINRLVAEDIDDCLRAASNRVKRRMSNQVKQEN